MNDAAWDYAWMVVAPQETITYFSADLSHAEEPLEYWSNAELECLINEYAPAHTVVMFQYWQPYSEWDDSASTWDDGDSVWDQWSPSR